MTQKQIANYVKCAEATVSRWARDLAEPEAAHLHRLRALCENYAEVLNREEIERVSQSDRWEVLLDSQSKVLAISPPMRGIMTQLGIRDWSTKMTPNGLLRHVSIERDGDNPD